MSFCLGSIYHLSHLCGVTLEGEKDLLGQHRPSYGVVLGAQATPGSVTASQSCGSEQAALTQWRLTPSYVRPRMSVC